MASTAAQKAEDDAAVEEQRAKFGDAAAARLAADLYKLRRTPPPGNAWSGLPRGLIVLIAIWVGLLETAEKLPFLLLSYPQYEATLAELHAKMLQPATAQAQLDKMQNEARASEWQPFSTAAQAYDAQAKFINDASAISPDSFLKNGNMKLFDLRP